LSVQPVPEDAIPLGRARDRRFVAALVEELANAPALTEDILIAAAQKAYDPPGRTRTTEQHRAYALFKAQQKLALTQIGDAIASYYGAVTGFSLADAAELHVAHIKGELTKQHVVTIGKGEEARTEVVDVKIPPSYQALRDLLTLTLPKQPKQVNIDQRSMTARFNFTGAAQPAIDATPIALDGK
jgi:hypothetical protein